jgi:uncharacterized protein (TIGR00251 family)
VVEVWVQPRASRDEVSGLQGEAVKVRLAAPPVEGRANDALVRLLAKRLGVPRTAVGIVRGQAGRRKTVRVEGLGPEETRKRLGV